MTKSPFLRSKTYATARKDLFAFDARELLQGLHQDINLVLASRGTSRDTQDDLERRYNAMMTAWDEWAAKAKSLKEHAAALRELTIHG